MATSAKKIALPAYSAEMTYSEEKAIESGGKRETCGERRRRA